MNPQKMHNVIVQLLAEPVTTDEIRAVWSAIATLSSNYDPETLQALIAGGMRDIMMYHHKITHETIPTEDEFSQLYPVLHEAIKSLFALRKKGDNAGNDSKFLN